MDTSSSTQSATLRIDSSSTQSATYRISSPQLGTSRLDKTAHQHILADLVRRSGRLPLVRNKSQATKLARALGGNGLAIKERTILDKQVFQLLRYSPKVELLADGNDLNELLDVALSNGIFG
jgi:hypothetical protein